MKVTEIFIIFLLLCILYITFKSIIVIIKPVPKPIPVPEPIIIPVPSQQMIGGCAGTRYGCCPNGVTSKINVIGTNCV